MAIASTSYAGKRHSLLSPDLGSWLPLWLFCLALQLAMLVGSLRNPYLAASYSGFFSSSLFKIFCGFLVVTCSVQIMRKIAKVRPKSPLRYLIQLGRDMVATPASWAIPAINYVCITSLLLSFEKLKALVGIALPFSWDMAFVQIDRDLHFGLDPWRISHDLLSSDIASWVLNMAYNIWFFLLLGSIFACILFTRKTKLRAQFLLTMALLWILGGFVLAMVFASAGPCFYHLILPQEANPYAALMQQLQASHVRLLANDFAFGLPALATQDMLWKNFVSSGDILGGGISAFPSMHVAMAVAMALLATRLNRYLAMVFWVFALIIQIGSVHLAWHYAVDGYASAILAVLLWKLSGWLIGLSDRRLSARHGDEFHLHARA